MTLEDYNRSTKSISEIEGNSAQHPDDNRGIGENTNDSKIPSGVSQELTTHVLDEMRAMQTASTGEVAKAVGKSQKQTKKALDFLKEIEVVSQEKFTQKRAWNLEEDKLTPEIVDAIEGELNSVETINYHLMKLNLSKHGKDSRVDRFTNDDGELEPPSFVKESINRT